MTGIKIATGDFITGGGGIAQQAQQAQQYKQPILTGPQQAVPAEQYVQPGSRQPTLFPVAIRTPTPMLQLQGNQPPKSDGKLLEDWFGGLGLETGGFRPIHGGDDLDAADGRIIVHLGELRLVFHRKGDTLAPDKDNPSADEIKDVLRRELEARRARAEAKAQAARDKEAADAAAAAPTVSTADKPLSDTALRWLNGGCGTARVRFGDPLAHDLGMGAGSGSGASGTSGASDDDESVDDFMDRINGADPVDGGFDVDDDEVDEVDGEETFDEFLDRIETMDPVDDVEDADEETKAAPAAPASIEDALSRDPNVRKLEVSRDGEGRPSRLTATMKDGASVVVDMNGTVTRTKDGVREVVDTDSGRFVRTNAAGEETLRFDRGDDNRYQVTVGRQSHLLDPGETPVLTTGEDGTERVLILNAGGVVVGGVQMDGVRILKDGIGAFVPGQNGERGTVVLNPRLLATTGDIGLVELPRDLLSEEQAALLEEGVAAMLRSNAVATAAFSGAGEWVDLPDTKTRVVGMRLIGNRLQIDIENRFKDGTPDDPMRIVIDEDGTAYTLIDQLLIRDKKENGGWTHLHRAPNGEWVSGVSLQRDDPSTFSIVMRALGEVAEVIFSPFQAALYGILGSIQYFGSGLYGDQAGLAEAWVPVSDICDEHGLQPSVFYGWLRQLLENAPAALVPARQRKRNDSREQQFITKVEKLEAKLAKKDEVIAEISEEFVKVKKTLGEL